MEEPYVYKVFEDKEEARQQPGKLFLRKAGLGANRENPDKALFAYPIKHYTDFLEGTGIQEESIGKQGENLAVLEMDEYTVFVGDTFRFGKAIIQAAGPGPVQSEELIKTGWYFRVLEEGMIEEGLDLELIERPCPEWSIAACNEIIHIYKDDLRIADELFSCKLLSPDIRKLLRKRVRGF